MENKVFDYAVVGGGILGAAIAYELVNREPSSSFILFEKEESLASHQTGNNSGVMHSGLYYKPGSKKAKLCLEGKRLLADFAKEHKIPHDTCGKIVVATSESELESLEKIFQNGISNGCEEITKIDGEGIKKFEPYCQGIAGIHVPSTGIIDYKAVTSKLVELALSISKSSKVLFSTPVQELQDRLEYSEIKTNSSTFRAKKVIVCSGLHADKLAKKESNIDIKIVPFRGDYYKLSETGKHKVKNLIYPVPDPQFPFLGVHFTRMIDGNVECGPNAVFSFKREGYSKWDFNLGDSLDALFFQGTWKLFFKHWKQGLEEYRRAFSKKRFLNSLQKLIPSLTMNDIVPARSGVRAQALDSKGNLVYDFEIVQSGRHFHVLNAPSPAATACLSIARHISDQVEG